MRMFPKPCLVADVGGTNARLAMLAEGERSLSPVVTLPTGSHTDFADTVKAAIELAGFEKPKSFLLAAAGAIEGRHITLTNAATLRGMLTLDGDQLCQRLSLKQGVLLNDFEALAMALPALSGADLLPIGGGQVVSDAPRIVVGAGTGLGVGALLWVNGKYFPLASEGGHTALAPENADDFRLWPLLGEGRLSGDDLLSGRGLTTIYRALAQRSGLPPMDDAPAAITLRGLADSEPLASETIDLFLGLLGRFAGDMAITFGATGGVYIAGGIAPRLAARIAASAFRTSFEAKQCHQPFLQAIPVWLITSPHPALRGLNALVETPEMFALDFKARCWA